MSYREIEAHKQVYETSTLQRWAITRADFLNANRGPDSIPFTIDDILGRGDYEARKRQATKDKFEVARMNAKLAGIRRGSPTDGIPDWAIGEYKGRMN